jgi:dUTP pyrophosphatase
MVGYHGEEEKLESYYLYPRSSISKTPLMLANHVGVVDSGYRGKIMAALRHVTGNIPYDIKRGDRLIQICSRDLSPFDFRLSTELSSSDRGEGGFGSTGV